MKIERNLYYETTIHDCIIGFTRGKIRPNMSSAYLITNL